MWLGLLSLVGYPLLVILLIAIVAALLLSLGTALTFLFAVSVWEATVVVTVVAAGAFWLLVVSGISEHIDEYSGETAEDEWQPRIADLNVRPNRRGGRRQR